MNYEFFLKKMLFPHFLLHRNGIFRILVPNL